jgi:hypothetical protein
MMASDPGCGDPRAGRPLFRGLLKLPGGRRWRGVAAAGPGRHVRPQMRREWRVHALDPADHVADPGGDGFAGPLVLVSQAAGAPGQAAAALADQRVALGPGGGWPLGSAQASASAISSSRSAKSGAGRRPAPSAPSRGLPARARAAHATRSAGESRPGAASTPRGRPALGVPHPHRHPAIGQRPQRALTPEHPGGQRTRLARRHGPGVAGEPPCRALRLGPSGPARPAASGLLGLGSRPQPGQLVPAAQRPGPGAEPFVHGACAPRWAAASPGFLAAAANAPDARPRRGNRSRHWTPPPGRKGSSAWYSRPGRCRARPPARWRTRRRAGTDGYAVSVRALFRTSARPPGRPGPGHYGEQRQRA